MGRRRLPSVRVLGPRACAADEGGVAVVRLQAGRRAETLKIEASDKEGNQRIE